MCQSTINLFKKQTVITMIHIRLDNFFHIFHVMVKSLLETIKESIDREVG